MRSMPPGKAMQAPGAVDGCGCMSAIFLAVVACIFIFLIVGGVARSFERQPRSPLGVAADYGVPICANYGDRLAGDAWGRTVTRYGGGGQVVSITTEAHKSC